MRAIIHSVTRDRKVWSAGRLPIKKTPTEAGYARFDTEKNERHHADKFWALALAVHAAGLGKENRRARQKVSASIV